MPTFLWYILGAIGILYGLYLLIFLVIAGFIAKNVK